MYFLPDVCSFWMVIREKAKHCRVTSGERIPLGPAGVPAGVGTEAEDDRANSTLLYLESYLLHIWMSLRADC